MGWPIWPSSTCSPEPDHDMVLVESGQAAEIFGGETKRDAGPQPTEVKALHAKLGAQIPRIQPPFPSYAQ